MFNNWGINQLQHVHVRNSKKSLKYLQRIQNTEKERSTNSTGSVVAVTYMTHACNMNEGVCLKTPGPHPASPASGLWPHCLTLGPRLSEECGWVPASVLTRCTCIPCSRCLLECRPGSAQRTLAGQLIPGSTAGRSPCAGSFRQHPHPPITERNPRANSASWARGVVNSEALLTSQVLCGLRGLHTLAGSRWNVPGCTTSLQFPPVLGRDSRNSESSTAWTT